MADAADRAERHGGEGSDEDDAEAAAVAMAAEAAAEADVEMNFDEEIRVGRSDFMAALEEVVPNFGGGAAGGWDASDFGEGDADDSQVSFTADGLPVSAGRQSAGVVGTLATVNSV